MIKNFGKNRQCFGFAHLFRNKLYSFYDYYFVTGKKQGLQKYFNYLYAIKIKDWKKV
jgi:hypothetical protein